MDEVQSGFGRTGTFFCFEQAGINPDIIILAKGLGSGLPISVVGSTKELMDTWTLAHMVVLMAVEVPSHQKRLQLQLM